MKKDLLFAYCGYFFMIIGLDRITKYFVIDSLKYEGVTEKIYSFLSLRLQFNRGISWGLLHSNDSLQTAIVTCLTIIVIIVLFVHSYNRARMGRLIAPQVLVLAGAVSNLIDRFWYDGVVDFISFSYKGWSFPVFNFADVYIVLGVFSMILILLGERESERHVQEKHLR